MYSFSELFVVSPRVVNFELPFPFSYTIHTCFKLCLPTLEFGLYGGTLAVMDEV